jgi:hypothetical protein
MIVKMTILRLFGSSDDKEKIGVARPEGPPLRWFRYRDREEETKDKNRRDREEIQVEKIKTETIYYHWLNQR